MAQHNEIEFEREICEHLAAHGWEYSQNDNGYDRELALFPEDVFGWLADTQPEQLAKHLKPGLTGPALESAKHGVLQALSKTLDADPAKDGGTLSVLRRGFKHINAKFAMCQFAPNTTLNTTTAEKYAKVRLRVTRQVHYSTRCNNSIDLVFFVNGLPVATAELKTDFTQNITDAILQYKTARLPKGEPLLAFGSRALVHFAVSNSEVEMTTKLAGPSTVFLPFNRGNQHHKGNPANPEGSPAAYLWETILARDTWLDILGRFMHLEIRDSVDPITGTKSRKKTMLFPRYHQWEVVTRLVAAARTEGPGHKYLVQHSAGSGKTNSISWLAHRLSGLHNDADEKVFDSVIVVTDRTVLDSQLQEAIKQIDKVHGVVAHIDGLGGSKSQLLADALAARTPIIIVTIQTFPHALDAIADRAELASRSFAIIADEAHSSQAGEASKRLKDVLSPGELVELSDGGSIDTEDILAAQMTARASTPNISFFAFTATPKGKTLELFGRPGSDGLPAPFHLYSMQQAIEEGFILDVLTNYTPYKTAFRLTHNGRAYESDTDRTGGTIAVKTDGPAGEDLVDKSAAITSVMNWVKLHPTNISQKVQIIVEHFRQNIAWRLDGKAKAMVVTSSRKAAVRYKVAFDKYVAEHGYTDVAALVAFSGEVIDTDTGPDKFTETSLNPRLNGRDLRDAFNTDEYQVMLVANKFQTGFDQPLLVAMYVDKKLSGVAAVQTLSRLNRTLPPKKDQTFVLDFTNDPKDIVDAFEPYYEATTLSGVTDPNIIHTLASKLDMAAIYTDSEVAGFAEAFVAGKGNNALTGWITPARQRFRDGEHQAIANNDQTARDELDMFRKDVSTYIKLYDFLSQIVDYEDPMLEARSRFLKHLAPTITSEQINHEIDLSTVQFDYIDQHKQATAKNKLTGEATVDPMREAGSGVVRDPELVRFEEIIAKINDLFSGEHTEASTRAVVTHIRDKLTESETLQEQAKANSLAQFSASPDIKTVFTSAVIESMKASEDLSGQILSSEAIAQTLLDALLPDIHRALNDAERGDVQSEMAAEVRYTPDEQTIDHGQSQ